MKEYGADKLIYRNSDIAAGKAEDGVFHVSIVDDVLATGGTAEGIAKRLVGTKLNIGGKEYSVKVNEFIFIVELDGLNGRDRLAEIAAGIVADIEHERTCTLGRELADCRLDERR